MVKIISDEKDGQTVEDLAARLGALTAERELLRAEVAQLETFQKQCDIEADHLRDLFNNSEDVGVYRLRTNPDDPEHARLVYINKAGRRLLGLSETDNYESWFSRLHPDDIQKGLEMQAEALETGVFNAALRIFQEKDNSWRWMRHYSFAVDNERHEKEQFNGFLWDVTDEVQARSEADRQGDRLRRLSYRLYQEEERQWQSIAGAMHDKVGQSLSLLRFILVREGKTSPGDSALTQRLELVDQVIKETRALTAGIYPNSLHEAGLVKTLEWLCCRGPDFSGLDIRFEADVGHLDLDKDMAIFLYRAAMELLNNSKKNSGARQVCLSLFENNEGLCLRVTDDGLGFAYGGDQDDMAGFGLFSIREKLRYFDGSLDVVSSPGNGADITITLPL